MITHVFAAGVKRRTKIHTIYDRQNRRGALVACRVIAGALVSVNVKVTVLVGGVGGARFLLGVQRLLGSDPSKHQINAVVNIGDDA